MGPWGNSSNISTSSRNDTESAKGLKAGINLTVNGGIILVVKVMDYILMELQQVEQNLQILLFLVR